MSLFSIIVQTFGRVTYYTHKGPEVWTWDDAAQKPTKHTTNAEVQKWNTPVHYTEK